MSVAASNLGRVHARKYFHFAAPLQAMRRRTATRAVASIGGGLRCSSACQETVRHRWVDSGFGLPVWKSSTRYVSGKVRTPSNAEVDAQRNPHATVLAVARPAGFASGTKFRCGRPLSHWESSGSATAGHRPGGRGSRRAARDHPGRQSPAKRWRPHARCQGHAARGPPRRR